MGKMEFRQFHNTLDGGGQPHVSAALPLFEESELPIRKAGFFPGSMREK
jgi:hypothetical protein